LRLIKCNKEQRKAFYQMSLRQQQISLRNRKSFFYTIMSFVIKNQYFRNLKPTLMFKNIVKAILVVLAFSVIPKCLAQQQIIDSLEQQLVNPTNSMTKAELFNELSWYYSTSDPQKGLEKAQEAMAMANKENDSLQLGVAYEREASNFQSLGQDSLVLKSYKNAENIYRSINHKKRLAALSFNLGNFHLFRANYQKSLKYGDVALKVFESNKDTVKIARTYNQIGTNHIYLGNYTKALEIFQKGTLILEISNRKTFIFNGDIQGNIGLLHEKLSDFKTALIFQQKALEIYKANNYKFGIANIYNNLGKLYGHLDEPTKSLEMFKASYDIKKELGNKYRTANALTNLGIAYSEIGDYDKALDFLKRSKKAYKELKHHTNLSTVEKNIGEIYLEKNAPLKAQASFSAAVSAAQNAEDKRAIYQAKEGLSEANFALANYKSAFTLQKEAITLKDSLLSDDKRDEIATLKAKYQYDKEKAILEAQYEKDKAIKQAEIKQQVKNRNIGIAAGIFTIIALLTGLTLYRRKKEADLNSKIARSQLQTLKAQMNPHFVFNTLNSINDFVVKNDKDKASQYLVSFSEMMRRILEDTNADEVTLSEEVNFLETYLKLEQQRLNHAFDFKINLEPILEPDDVLIPPALIQPFVENSIWHGFNGIKDKGQLDISFSKLQNLLICTIEDNGNGLALIDYNDQNKKGFGTKSVQERLDLLNKQKGTNAKVEIINKDKGVKIVIYLPFLKEA